MRLTHVGLMAALGAAFCAPAMAQSGSATSNRPAVPSTAPYTAPSTGAITAAPKVAPMPAMVGAPININTASESQLDTIPQIGPKRAAAIIKNRPYKTVDELVTKKAVSNGVFKKIRAHITV